jgi:hypothetical protein
MLDGTRSLLAAMAGFLALLMFAAYCIEPTASSPESPLRNWHTPAHPL